jgi:hypothetical protein
MPDKVFCIGIDGRGTIQHTITCNNKEFVIFRDVVNGYLRVRCYDLILRFERVVFLVVEVPDSTGQRKISCVNSVDKSALKGNLHTIDTPSFYIATTVDDSFFLAYESMRYEPINLRDMTPYHHL